MIRNFTYFFREALQSMARNRILSIATISTVAVCILILGVAVLMTINAGNMMTHLESDIEIMAYLDKELQSHQVGAIKAELEEIEGVKSVQFRSKEEALEYLQESFARDEYDLEATLGKNPLPDTYVVKADDPHQVPKIAAVIEKIAGITGAKYGQGVVENLFSATRWIRIISMVFIGLLSLGAIFLIATTVRLAIFARRREIYLMKLIGSTDWFIRWPFFIEGIILGSLGAGIAILFLAAGYGSIISNVDNVLFLPLVTSSDMLLQLYITLVAVGGVLGVLGTLISVNRFLDV